MFDWIFYLLIGVAAGVLSGLLGIGGGIVVVPSLATIFAYTDLVPADKVMHVAVATSLATMIFTTQASARAHYRHGRIIWAIYRLLLPGIVLGTISGVLLADLLASDVLKTLFGLFLIFVAISMLFPVKKIKRRKLLRALPNHIFAFITGTLSALLGVGGGALIVPYLHHCGVPIHHAIGLSVTFGLTVSVIGAISTIFTGMNEVGLPAASIGYIYVPAMILIALTSMTFAPLGAKLSYRLNGKTLSRLFGVFLLITGARMLW